MRKINKAIRLIVFICLIVLAGLGVGISGGVPIPMTKNRRNSEKDKTELIDKQNVNSNSEEAQS